TALQAQELADLIAQRLIGRAAKDLQLFIMTSPLRLALALRNLMLPRRLLVIRARHRGLHFVSCRTSHSVSPCRHFFEQLGCLLPSCSYLLSILAGRLGFEPRQSAQKALDLPLVDRPVNRRLPCPSLYTITA